MRFLNYIRISEHLTPKGADEALLAAKKSGADGVLMLFEAGENPFSGKTREKLLSVFRAAVRHKIKVFLADDSFSYSGTAFGELSSVKELNCRCLFECGEEEITEGDTVLEKKSGRAVCARFLAENKGYPYGAYPDLLNPYATELIIENVYDKFVREYKKFAGYEFAGFICIAPSYTAPFEGLLPYSEGISEDKNEKERYIAACRSLLEKNFAMPIKKFCRENALDIIFTPCETGLTEEFCKRESAVDLDMCLLGEDKKTIALSALLGKDCIFGFEKWDDEAEYLSRIRRFLHEARGIERIECDGEEIALSGERDVLIINNSDERKEVSITGGAALAAADPERNEQYEFEDDVYCEFSPYSFLCLKKKAGGFSEPLPVRVGGVRTKRRAENAVEIAHEGGRFVLPDEPLNGKYIEIYGEFSRAEIRIGSSVIKLFSAPFTAELFDFQRGASGKVETDGQIDKIEIV